MAQRALVTGTTVRRRRAMFGLLDADGWGWAGLKAFAWMIIIIFILGYLPDRAYYFTVNRTIDLGILAWSPINLCPAEPNEDLPCPAPVGAVTPWHAAPSQLALPAPRTDGVAVQLGTNLLYIGGSDGQAAVADVYVAEARGVGNHGEWQPGPALPEPRSEPAVIFEAGSLYVIGGYDAEGAPTTTVYSLTPDPATGELGEWTEAAEALALPEGRAAAAAVSSPAGLLLIGGSNADGPVATVLRAPLNENTGALEAWVEEAPLFQPVTGAAAAVLGEHVWVFGGSDASGPVATVQRGDLGQAGDHGEENPDEGRVTRWGVNPDANLPVARADMAGWSVSGALYVAGGTDGTSPAREVYWAVPDPTGDITEWRHLEVSDLPEGGLAGAAPVVSGPNVILVGGEAGQGPVATSQRANLAAQAPFFQLGLVGATVPALKIEGEIGQQLGYMNAAGVGTVNFILLLLVGWAFAHKEQTRDMLGRVARRRHRR